MLKMPVIFSSCLLMLKYNDVIVSPILNNKVISPLVSSCILIALNTIYKEQLMNFQFILPALIYSLSSRLIYLLAFYHGCLVSISNLVCPKQCNFFSPKLALPQIFSILVKEITEQGDQNSVIQRKMIK